ncbi:hypothetical protein [Flavobacterium aquicola]|uniref:Uncharacterized protein n=1 Tax=Flavobacterium aquicola TaxID=1682742 RepID=A0A3E0EE34_9FLAO|nr:hypothetical protein [Flavobacterium aquicola]REG96464.1 hypothetical protein C8P67_109110 [Flavobacterium aquicola]
MNVSLYRIPREVMLSEVFLWIELTLILMICLVTISLVKINETYFIYYDFPKPIEEANRDNSYSLNRKFLLIDTKI